MHWSILQHSYCSKAGGIIQICDNIIIDCRRSREFIGICDNITITGGLNKHATISITIETGGYEAPSISL